MASTDAVGGDTATMRPVRPLVTLSRDIALFFVITISWTWTFWILVALQENALLSVGVPSGLLEILGAAGPMLTAIVLTARLEGGRAVGRLLGRLLHFRIRWYWWIIALVVPFIVHWTPVLIADVAGGLEAGYTNFGGPLPMALVMLLPWFVLFSLEEVGWRGFALPRMQERRSALSAGFLLGVGWGFWHVPLAFIPGQYEGAVSPWTKIIVMFAFMIAMSLLWTWIFNNTGGSLIMANFFHVFINTSWSWLDLPPAPEWIYEWITPVLVAVVIIALVTWRWGAESMAVNGKKVTWSTLQAGRRIAREK